MDYSKTASITCVVTGNYTQASFFAIRKSIEVLKDKINLVKIYWFSNRPCFEDFGLPIEWTYISSLSIMNWVNDHDKYLIKLIPYIVETDYNIIVQYDGMAVNPDAWTDKFLEYDFIGARWLFSDIYNVGNGGFSLRTKKLYDAIKAINPPTPIKYKDYPDIDNIINLVGRGDPSIVPFAKQDCYIPEDALICRVLRYKLENEYGIKFAPPEIADQFSIEHFDENNPSPWLGKSLGFHGKHGIHRYYGVEINL